jgi:hypothetical protein
MLPPSPSQPPASSHHTSQRPPLGAFPSNRELPGPTSLPRPGGMSITALISGDAPSSSHSQSSPLNTSLGASPNSRGRHPSPPRRIVSNSRPDYGYHRPHTPDQYAFAASSKQTDPASRPTASSPSKINESPDQARRMQTFDSPHYTTQMQDNRTYNNFGETQEKEQLRSGNGNIPQRPNSQPAGLVENTSEERRRFYDPTGYRRPLSGHPPEDGRNVIHDSQFPPRDRESKDHTQQGSEAIRPVTVQPVTLSSYSPPSDRVHPTSAPNTHLPHAPLHRQRSTDETGHDHVSSNREDMTVSNRLHFAARSSPPASRTDSAPQLTRSIDYIGTRPPNFSAPPTSDPSSMERKRSETGVGTQPGSGNQGRASPYEPHSQKSFPYLGPDANRRTGRASPLPQAVQGVSSQPVGPGGNPGIKSEFGRMFSGLGGINAPSRNGTQTPSRQSPFSHGDTVPVGGEGYEMVMSRSMSQPGRRHKRVNDEEAVFDSESGDGRGTPSLGGLRSTKRSKHGNPPAHHHHHTHAHQYVDKEDHISKSANLLSSHHHHHHRTEEEQSTAGHEGNGVSRFHPSQANTGNTSTGHHHHHHHHGAHPPHHHHHAPRPGVGATSRSPKLIAPVVNIQPVLDKVSDLPRKHLGSQLYEAKPVMPDATVPLGDKFMFSSFPKPLPSFGRDKANCTFTIRVPRYYLRSRQRELLCRRPYIWGARIYRDDSDPLAAAIHSGWILGSWDKEEVDINLLDPRISGGAEVVNPDEPVLAQPSAPLDPPVDYDLHITLLILPSLEKYHSTTEYGIRSRKAGSGYHGMSFMVLSMRWVDEGIGSRGQERGAEAIKKRLNAANALVQLLTTGREAQSSSRALKDGIGA